MVSSYVSICARVWIVAISIAVLLSPIMVFAWGDNTPPYECVDETTGETKTCYGRPSYTIDQIDNGAIGATPLSDGENYKNSPNYPGQIIFNTISDSTIGDEKNFVGARECALDGVRCLDAETNANPTKDTKWKGSDITVEDGKFYVIRLYVHNNNPNGYDAVAENTRVSFNIPNGTSKQIQVNGFITSSNASPSEYWDYVNFNSEVPFHLDYVYGSARLNNNKTQDEAIVGGYSDYAGWQLSDDIVKAGSTKGVLVGSEARDGRVPGCYKYANYVTIRVRAIFDYEYVVKQKVRLADSGDRTWKESVDAKVGDKVEYRIEYKNTSNYQQDDVEIKDIIPSGLKCVNDVTVRNGGTQSKVTVASQDFLANGLNIGNYGKNMSAYVYFTAEVVDEGLTTGVNTLTNWSKVEVEQKTVQDQASVIVYKNAAWFSAVRTIVILIGVCAGIIAVWPYRQRIKEFISKYRGSSHH